MAEIQRRVSQQYMVDLGNRNQCGPDVQLFCYANNVYRVLDERTLIPTPNPNQPLGLIPIRGWIFPGVIDIVTMYIRFSQIAGVPGFGMPILHWRLMVGMGGATERVAEGAYTIPTPTEPTLPDEAGLLVQWCGRMFDVLELHVRIEDPAEPNVILARKVPFGLAFLAAIQNHCESKAQTGLNGVVTWIAPTYHKPLVP